MIQWKDLEVITKNIEDEKPRVVAHLYHNPEVFPVINLHSDWRVEENRVYLGGFIFFDKEEDQSYKSKCEKLEKELEYKTELIWKLKAKISELYDCM